MIKNNYFYIKKLKNVVIIGFHSKLVEIEKFLKKININCFIITSKDQSKEIQNLKFNIFEKIDSKFKKFIKINYDIEK